MRIVFRCDPALIDWLPRPVAAGKALPGWLRRMVPRVPSEMHGRAIRTVKQCPPFVDAMSHGFMVLLPCDVHVRAGRFAWQWDTPRPSVEHQPRAPLSFHVPAQLAGSPFEAGSAALIKFNGFWTIELEPGWSLYATHPVNRNDLPFRTLTGLVDADRFSDAGINFPAQWVDADFDGTLARGTPVAQCFAVPRERAELAFEAFTPERAKRYDDCVAEVLQHPGVYRRRFRVKRGAPD
jgi:hypothetical protein